MPISTPDASQFTRLKKLSSAQAQTPQNSVKVLTHLYMPFIRTAGVTDFLSSTVTNKITVPRLRPLAAAKSLSQIVAYNRPQYIR